MPAESLPTIGAVTLIALFLLKEVFAYLKNRKEGNGNGKEGLLNQSILNELQRMNNNHLHTIDETLKAGNERLIDVIHADNTRMIEILGEIKGHLNNK